MIGQPRADGRNLRSRFLTFHIENLHVYHAIVALAREYRARRGPYAKIGIDLLIARLRWDVVVNTSGDPYRLANEHRAFYARLVMHREPDLRGVFDTRPSEADFAEPNPDWLTLWAEAEQDSTWLDYAGRVLDDPESA